MTNIEWTDEVWNPLRGCSRVSEGCRNCYAERMAFRFSGKGMPYEGLVKSVNGHPVWTGDIRLAQDVLDKPLHWKKPKRIFVNSMSDLFHEAVPDEWIDQVFAVMALAPQHQFQILTKRAERMHSYLQLGRANPVGLEAMAQTLEAHSRHPDSKIGKGIKLAGDIPHLKVWPLPNVWLGVSAEDQKAADERIPLLLKTPAAVRWVSAEPLLGPVDLSAYLSSPATSLDWVVAGGESGPNARPMHPDWARHLHDQCFATSTPFFFKQWGEWAPRSQCYHTLTNGHSAADLDPNATKWPCIRLTSSGHDGRDLAHASNGDDCYMQKVGKTLAGRLLDGVLHDAFPQRESIHD